MLAITGIRGLEVRVLVLLWHLADTFGRVGREGVILPLPLTHQLIGRLAGATRPSVSTALKALETDGAVTKRLGGGFVLHGEPPDAAFARRPPQCSASTPGSDDPPRAATRRRSCPWSGCSPRASPGS